jgi:hypothetical protein
LAKQIVHQYFNPDKMRVNFLTRDASWQLLLME